jgi:hypothetical protein
MPYGYRSVGERPSRLCHGTHAMTLAIYAALAHINKGARLFSHFAIELPRPWTRGGEFSVSCRYLTKS